MAKDAMQQLMDLFTSPDADENVSTSIAPEDRTRLLNTFRNYTENCLDEEQVHIKGWHPRGGATDDFVKNDNLMTP